MPRVSFAMIIPTKTHSHSKERTNETIIAYTKRGPPMLPQGVQFPEAFRRSACCFLYKKKEEYIHEPFCVYTKKSNTQPLTSTYPSPNLPNSPSVQHESGSFQSMHSTTGPNPLDLPKVQFPKEWDHR